jgi:A/G-specific adenine glycosylase
MPNGSRAQCEILLERRPDELSVMPGLWELPELRDIEVPESDLLMTVRHAIMSVNHLVRIRNVRERDINRLTSRRGERRWVGSEDAAAMALTGLSRKALIRAKLLNDKEFTRRK